MTKNCKKEFTLSELQTAYESILSHKIDKRNFRKKIISGGMIVSTKKYKKTARKPAELYTFKSKNIVIIPTYTK